MCLIPFILNAQNLEEARLFGQADVNGTARSMAIANAFTALGANPYALHSNPAGLGYYRRSEVQISLINHNNQIDNTFIGNRNSSSISRFQLGNLSYIQAQQLDNNNWKGLNWGVSYQKTNSYISDYSFKGVNQSNSIVDYFVEAANGIPYEFLNLDDIAPEDVPVLFGWEGWLIDTASSDIPNQYVGIIDGAGNTQSFKGQLRGSKNELAFGLGANYNDQWYIGGSLNVPFLRYNSTTIFDETDDDNLYNNFTSANFYSDVDIEGVGFGLNLGVSYKPNKWVRVGVNIQSPEWYSLTTTAYDSITTDLNNGTGFNQYTYGINYAPNTYNYRTPAQIDLGAAFFIKQRGFVSVDYSLRPYNRIRYNSSNDFLDDTAENELYNIVNAEITTNLKASHNIKIGAEIFLIKHLSLRAGYGLESSPYVNENAFSARQSISGGLGLSFKRVNFDLAYVHSSNNLVFQPYALGAESSTSKWAVTNGKVAASLGVKF